jgi:hypothetical protein
MYNTTRLEQSLFYSFRVRCDCVHMVAWLTINHNSNVYYHFRYEWFHNTWLCAVDTTLSNTICQSFPAGQRFFPEAQVSSSFKRYTWNIAFKGVKHQWWKNKNSHTFMSSFVQQLYSIVQYPDNIFQIHDSIILCFFSDVRNRFWANWQ